MTEAGSGFEEFVRSRQAALVRLGWALTGDRALGEDLAQAALDRVWQRWSRVSAGGGDPWPYVQKVAVSLALTWRRRRWHGERPASDLPEQVAPRDETDEWVSRRMVAAWLDGLPPRQRAVIVLRYLCDVSVEDTADRLGCSTGTVKSQTAKALQTLRRHVTDPRISEGGSG